MARRLLRSSYFMPTEDDFKIIFQVYFGMCINAFGLALFGWVVVSHANNQTILLEKLFHKSENDLLESKYTPSSKDLLRSINESLESIKESLANDDEEDDEEEDE
jgi:hypothetical protein